MVMNSGWKNFFLLGAHGVRLWSPYGSYVFLEGCLLGAGTTWDSYLRTTPPTDPVFSIFVRPMYENLFLGLRGWSRILCICWCIYLFGLQFSVSASIDFSVLSCKVSYASHISFEMCSLVFSSTFYRESFQMIESAALPGAGVPCIRF